ncbi:hypothetical protein NliqN6_3784 [Naganishia liquefaciens]|uniref:Uncharacterized protein n=1 Tax=Naganishia liquefaciens TaxID=104408 RepID=A0A8H3TUG1_9TREE|nr:hypothetical protein NliqN6_3784 [Naganishia liquefaciens]
MPSSSPSPKRARTSGSSSERKPLHNLYQVIYNLTLGKSDISRYVLHCYLNDNEDWLKFRLYALVTMVETEDREKEVLSLWKGYLPMSSIEKSYSPSALASSISAGELHISGVQSKIRGKDSGDLKLHLNHNSDTPISVELSSSNDVPESSLMDICCALIAEVHSQAVPTVAPAAAPPPIKSDNSKQSSDEVEALRIRNEKLQHELRSARRQYSAAKGGYDLVDPKDIVQVPKGRSTLQPTVKKAKKIERGFAEDDEW